MPSETCTSTNTGTKKVESYVVTMVWRTRSGEHFAQLDLMATAPDRAAKRCWLTALCPPLQWFDLDYSEVRFEVENEDTGETTILNPEAA